MFNFTDVALEKLVIHEVGNKLRDEGIHTSPTALEMKDGNIEELLLKYLLSSFKNQTFYKFVHERDIHLNETYISISNIFINPDTFQKESVKILANLYNYSCHPKIKGGEFYMVYFKNCIVDEQKTDAIGIFKTEKKDTYLKITRYANEFTVGSEKCINTKKLDKGCIVFNTNSEDGYRIVIVDNAKGTSEDSLYWKNDFLQVASVQNDHFHTQNYLAVCQDFVENIYGEVYQADKKDKVVLMNEAVHYFDTHSEFNLKNFTQEVLKDPELMKQFEEHKQNYDLNQGIDGKKQFSVSAPAVKEIKRNLKNLIKLDTDFEIKVKSSSSQEDNTQYIERGFDEKKGMNFYKVFFNEEE